MQIDKLLVPVTLDNYRGTGTIKQHVFKLHYDYKYGDKYESNISLCGKVKARHEAETPLSIKRLLKEQELLDDNCCKKCLKILNNQ
jgi:hypothetical protein